MIYVSAGYDLFPQELYVPNAINSVEDLRGGTCGATNPPGTGDDLYTQMMIDGLSNGTMVKGTDYEIIQIGAAAPAIVAAFDAGQIQCRVTLPPVTGLLDSLGAYKSLAVADDLPAFENYPFFGINAIGVGSKSTRTPPMPSFAATWHRSPGSTTPPTSSGPSRSWPRTPASTPPPRNPPTSGSSRVGTRGPVTWRRSGSATPSRSSSSTVRSSLSRATSLPEILDNTYVEAAYESLPDEVKNGPGPG